MTNTRDIVNELPSGALLRGRTLGDGDLNLKVRMNLLAAQPAFDLNAELTNVTLVALNDFLEAYAKVDVNRGKLDVFTEIAAKEGRFVGYVKPLLEDLDIVDLKDNKGPLKMAWEMVVSAVAHIFKNQAKDRLGTKIPFSGSFDSPNLGVMETIASALRNAFIKALPAKVEESITLRR